MSKYPPVHAGRQETFKLKGAGGKTEIKSVQHSLSDKVEGHGPHYEAGTVKVDRATNNPVLDSVGRPRLDSKEWSITHE